MSKFDYDRAIAHDRADEPFYGLIMGAMLRADTANIAKLRSAWPEIHHELQARYNAPGGILSTDPGAPIRTSDMLEELDHNLDDLRSTDEEPDDEPELGTKS